jgi:subtilisin family serine protease
MVKILLVLILFLTGCHDQPWQLRDLHLKEETESRQIIALIDTGLSSQLLKKYDDRILDVYNVIKGCEDVEDYHGHGSEMFLLGVSNQYGLLKRGQYVIIKAIDDQGEAKPHYLYLALKKAEEMGANIVNMSLGGMNEDREVNRQIEHMVKHHIILLAAAGDFGDKDVLYPACNKHVIGVGAYDRDHEIWKECNTGKGLDCLFPGVNLNLGKHSASGTSYACMIASCYTVRLLDYYAKRDKTLSFGQIKRLLSREDRNWKC